MNVEERIEAVRRLCSFEGRLAGTDAERRAANDLAAGLRDRGRRVEIEPTYVQPQWALAQALHCLLALAGSLVALNLPVVGFAIVLVTAVSMYLDLNGRFYLLRRIFFRRASQNVVSRGRRRDAAGTLVLCANYDTGRGGSAYGRGWSAVTNRLGALVPAPFSPARLVFWSIAVLLPLIGLRMAELDANWISILQLPPTLVLVLAIFLLVDIHLSAPVPGANVNASGVATAVSIADELDRDEPRAARRLGRPPRCGRPSGRRHAQLRPRSPRRARPGGDVVRRASRRSATARSASRPPRDPSSATGWPRG